MINDFGPIPLEVLNIPVDSDGYDADEIYTLRHALEDIVNEDIIDASWKISEFFGIPELDSFRAETNSYVVGMLRTPFGVHFIKSEKEIYNDEK